MKTLKINIGRIPAVIWGEKSDKVYIFVHGKMSCKESAGLFAKIAEEKGYQTISFDLPAHGERQGEKRKCDIWNGKEDLKEVGDYVFSKWERISLFGSSLGAFFSLHAYRDRKFENCLFQSPILDMEYLIHQMFIWFDVSEPILEEKREIETPVDILSWDYYTFVKENPIVKWNVPTHILYGLKDNLQSLKVIEDFTKKFCSVITVSENSEHPFMDESDAPVVENWMRANI